MLIAMPIVLACFGLQPCSSGTVPDRLIHSSSPVVIVSLTRPREDRSAGASRPVHLALQGVSIPSASTLSQTRRAQVALPRRVGSRASKGMLVLAGAVAGCYAGAYLGAAMDDSPDDTGALLGIPIGAAVGGWVVWNLVK